MGHDGEEGGSLAYGLRAPCDSPDPLEACSQTAGGSLYLHMATWNAANAEGARLLWTLAPDVGAVEKCHREAAQHDAELACELRIVVIDDGRGAQRLELDPLAHCPAPLSACVRDTIRPITQPIPLVVGREAPMIVLHLARKAPEELRK